ncbi:MAG: ketoacyl-ACP synthase III [Candidatus Omnitrophica bacterium]|nr:ketoacyl-ACP synthase III [Candidatus Omnitrophota bacterium]
MKNVGIAGLGHYLPKRVLTNSDLEQMVETSDEWITTRTGIRERRIAGKDEKTSDMAVRAAREALKNARLDPAKVELIVVATISPDSGFPSVACLVQKAVHAPHAAAFDVSAACSGFLYALTIAQQFIQNGVYKNALVIAAEKITTYVNWNDRSTCVLFGDGAGACVLKPVAGRRGILADYLHAQGHFGDLMMVLAEEREPLDQQTQMILLPHIAMQGQELFRVAVNSMAVAVEIAVRKAGLKLEDVDYIVPHQANDRIISAVARKLDFPKEKIFINIDRYGNMSAASIAVALYEAVEQKKIKRGDYVVLVAFGAGLVSAANVVRW